MADAAELVGTTARISKLPPDLQAKWVLFARRAKVGAVEIEKVLNGGSHDLSDLALQTGFEFIQSLLEAGVNVNKYSSMEDTMADNYSALLREKELAEARLAELGAQIAAARAVDLAEKISKWPEDAKESFRDYAEAVKIPDADIAHILRGKVELCSSGRSVRVSADFVEAYSKRVDLL